MQRCHRRQYGASVARLQAEYIGAAYASIDICTTASDCTGSSCRSPEGELRRVVCNVGTTGTNNSHNLVHRALQGLFKELGLTPNFLWDEKFEVPEVHLPYEHRKALQDARVDNTVAQIKRAQAGALGVGSALQRADMCAVCGLCAVRSQRAARDGQIDGAAFARLCTAEISVSERLRPC
jgi:hypothetical protein